MALPLNDANLWEELVLTKLEPNLFRKFEKPRLLTAPESTAVFYKATRSDAGWVITMGSGSLPERGHMLMFSDQDGRQFVFLTDSPKKIGASWELAVRKGYQSKYVRASVRASVSSRGWLASDFALPSDDFDPAQKRPLIETVFHSYTMLLRKQCRQTTVSTYSADDDPIVRTVLSARTPALLAEGTRTSAYAEPTSIAVGDGTVRFASFTELCADLNVPEYMRTCEKNSVASELIVPVVLGQSGGRTLDLGFIRARTGRDEGALTPEFIRAALEVAESIPRSLLQSNFVTLRESAAVTDVSTAGMALETESQALIAAWRDSRSFRFELETDAPEERLKVSLQKVHLVESNGHARMGGQLISVSAAQPDLTDAQTAGNLMLKKAIRRALAGGS